MLNADQFLQFIIKPCLSDLLMDSLSAEQLLLFTCANESRGGTYLHQMGGPAMGIYQMEPRTYNDLWFTYIMNKSDLHLKLVRLFNISIIPSEDRMIYDLRFATAMARIFYARIAEPLPSANDLDGIWDYYKKYYNTEKGAATKDNAIALYHSFMKT